MISVLLKKHLGYSYDSDARSTKQIAHKEALMDLRCRFVLWQVVGAGLQGVVRAAGVACLSVVTTFVRKMAVLAVVQ